MITLADVARLLDDPYRRQIALLCARWILWNEGKEPPAPTGDPLADELALLRAATLEVQP